MRIGREVPIARRNLLSDRVKFLVALAAVTLAIVLIVVVQSLYHGIKREYAAFVRGLPGDAWVAQKGVGGVIFSNSWLTDRDATSVAAVPGVTAVHRLYARVAAFEVDGRQQEVYVWTLEPGADLTDKEAAFLPDPGTIRIDRSFARQMDVFRGDELSFRGQRVTVGEVGKVGNVLLLRFAVLHPDDYIRLFGQLGAANFFLLSLGPEATDQTLGEIERRVEGAAVYRTEDFISVAQDPVGEFLPIIRVIMVISFIVGLAVLSLTIYSATIERTREFGIMKALGASPGRLYRIVLSQSGIIGAIGLGAGLGLALLVNRLAEDAVPQYVSHVRPQDVAFVVGLSAVMTAAATLLPISRVARVDPASVFRA